MTMVINVVLIILFCYIALISYYSDKKNGIIPNKNLLVIGIIAVILKILDYKNIDIMIIQLVIACIWLFFISLVSTTATAPVKSDFFTV